MCHESTRHADRRLNATAAGWLRAYLSLCLTDHNPPMSFQLQKNWDGAWPIAIYHVQIALRVHAICKCICRTCHTHLTASKGAVAPRAREGPTRFIAATKSPAEMVPPTLAAPFDAAFIAASLHKAPKSAPVYPWQSLANLYQPV